VKLSHINPQELSRSLVVPVSVYHHATAQRDVQRDEIVCFGATHLQQRLFGGKEIALGVEHLQVTDVTLARSGAHK
jgi:hypothetical protein